MDGFLIFCDRCFQTALKTNGYIDYYLTTCGKIFCQNCISLQTGCSKCGPNCSMKKMDNHINNDCQLFFKDYDCLLNQLRLIQSYQTNRYQTNIKQLIKQNVQLENEIVQYNETALALEEEIKRIEEKISNLPDSNQIPVQNCFDPKEMPFMSKMIKAMENEVIKDNNINNNNNNYLMEPDPNRSFIVANLNQTQSTMSSVSQNRRSSKGSIIGKAYPIRRTFKTTNTTTPMMNNFNRSFHNNNYRNNNNNSFGTQFNFQ